MRRVLQNILVLTIVFTVLFSSASAPVRAEASPESLPEFTSDELDYIASHEVLRVGYVQDRIPVSFSDENGELAGISRYIFDRISQLCGLKFEYIPLPAGDITYDYLLSQHLDLVTSVEYNQENQNANGILISNPYLSSRKVIVAQEGLNFKYGDQLTVAISTGSQTLRKVLNSTYPNFELIDYDSISDCFDAVNAGDADLLIQNQYVVEYWFSKPSYEKLKAIPVAGLNDQLCFSAVVAIGDSRGISSGNSSGTSPEEGSILIRILNKAIAGMSEDEAGSYTIQAVMENQYKFTLEDFLYRYRFAVGIFSVSSLVILFLLFLLTRQRIRFAESRADAKIKEQFLSTMSHEIRTPLNGLIGLNYLMAAKIEDKERLQDYLQQSTVTANYLLSLVNDILDMSKLQAQKLEISLHPVELPLLLDTVNSIVQSAMADRKLTYHVRSEISHPCVLGDEIRIQQVLLNLLDNARKFTPEGGKVELTVSQKETSDGLILTRCDIADTGCGISEDFQKHIFDTFSQDLGTVSKGNQGTGLGLPISRRLALLMNGDLTFVSKKGEGSTFTFTFTARPADIPQKEPASQPDSAAHRPRILVAEDNELNGEIILELLGNEGFTADLAENGKIALQMFSDSAPGTYGIILMDLLMPEMDGYEAAKAIRALNRPDAKTVRIIACTANTFSKDRARAMASGMDDFLAKPVDVEKLLLMLEQK